MNARPAGPVRLLVAAAAGSGWPEALQDLEVEGRDLAMRRVDRPEDLRAALAAAAWEAVLLDDGLPVAELLAEAAPSLPQVPLIVVSGPLDGAAAVDLVNLGAWDIVWKDHLDRLGPVLARALEEAGARGARIRAGQDAREALERQRLALAAIGFGVWERHLESGESFWDDTVFRIFGLEPRPGPQSGDLWASRVHPDDLKAVQDLYRMAQQQRGDIDLCYRIVRPDGSVRHVNSVGRVWASSDDPVTRALGLVRDVTDQVEAERARRDSEDLFSAVSEGMADGLFLSDASGRFLAVNRQACESLGYAREDLLSLGVADVDVGLDAEAIAEVLDAAPGTSRRFVTRQRRQDGTEFPVEISASVMLLGGRRLVLGLVRDISARLQVEEERRLMEAQLRHAEKLESLGSLAGGLAHDMNNILAAILAVSQVLRLRLEEDPGLAAALDTVIKAANRGRDLVRGLTNFARKDLGAAEPLDLNRLVRDEAALLERTLLQKVRLEIDLEEPLPPFQGESGAFGSALMNLCVNAVDAMPGGGTLTLRTRRLADGWLELAVADTGVGMPPEVVARALEPFFTTKAPGKGTGLGLAMVHGTVKAHGGFLDIQSQIGLGTVIRIRVPAVAAPGTPGAAAEAGAAEGRPGSRPLQVLLVDDDELIQATVPLLLRQLGHRPVSATSGEEGLALLRGGLQADVVILDCNMPGMGGAATYQKLRRDHPDLPVLMASGYLDPAADQLLRSDPLALVLAKPFTLDDLGRRLEALGPRGRRTL